MTNSTVDAIFMRQALDLAILGLGHVEPNPMVGCVLVKSGEVIGQGYHRKFGWDHAEIDAIKSLDDPADARDATAYVTLEPCCHVGKTPPCTRAIIDSGVTRVVVATQDPFVEVDGGGIQQLREAGIEVSVGTMQDEAQRLIAPFAKRIRTGLPWVIAKWAMTIDGRIATTTGQSKWISGDTSRHEVHRLRSRVDAIAVGMGTVAADDPMLDARLADGESPQRIATRVVFCQNRVPDLHSKLIQTADRIPTLLVTTPSIVADQLSKLVDRGVDSLMVDGGDRSSMVTPLLRHLGKNNATNVMIEGGAQLLSSFFSVDGVDEAHVYLGPKAFGGMASPGPIGGEGVQEVSDAWQFRLQQVHQFDDDVRLIYDRR